MSATAEIVRNWVGEVEGVMGPRETNRVARRAAIVARFSPGARPVDIARVLGLHYATILVDLKAMGWPIGRRGRPVGARKRPDIVQAVREEPHLSLKEIGARFNLTGERVRQILKNEGVSRVPPYTAAKNARLAAKREEVAARKADRRALSHLRLAQAMAMRQRGMAYSQIAAEFGLKNAACAATMYARARAAGVTVSP